MRKIIFPQFIKGKNFAQKLKFSNKNNMVYVRVQICSSSSSCLQVDPKLHMAKKNYAQVAPKLKILMALPWPKICLAMGGPKIFTVLPWPKVLMALPWPKIFMALPWPKIFMALMVKNIKKKNSRRKWTKFLKVEATRQK